MPGENLPSDLKEDVKPTESPVQSTVTAQLSQMDTLDDLIRRQIRTFMEGNRNDMDKCLSTLDKLYDDRQYLPAQRIAITVTHLNEEQQVWYKQQKAQIQEDWKFFCEQLKQRMINNKTVSQHSTRADDSTSKTSRAATLEDLIDANFEKYSGIGDGRCWLLQVINQFRSCGVRRDDQIDAIPFLLTDEAYLWYAENAGMISNFEQFSKLFLQQFKSTASSPTSSVVGTEVLAVPVPGQSHTSHLQRTVADEIIKKPTYFRGSQDDVQNWLEKLEQRFTMARWSDENKLQYISIHLQDDAYRWWMQTSSSIKSWSSFTEAIVRTFGSTRIQELAFEQLKWYKQTINQSITQYYDKVIELCKKVDPVMPDSLKLKYLMAGIKESLKTQVALHDPKSAESFLSSARKIEDIFALTATTDNEVITIDTTLNTTTYQSRPNQTNFTQKSNNNFQRNNFQNQTASQTGSTYNRNKSDGTYANQRYYPSRNTRWTQRSNACYNCGTLGHYARDCTRPHFQ